MKKIIKIICLIFLLSIGTYQVSASEKTELIKIDWSFNGLFGNLEAANLAGITPKIFSLFFIKSI